ncbi:MAG: methylated-DNA--[Abditibacteriota bacterium]|nr:methylated-DNA--[protein]-cysteine S-methyltransferase [Abditibacteriota bacterium]
MLTVDNILIEEQNNKITNLYFEKNTYKYYSMLLMKAYSQLEAYLAGQLFEFDLPLYLKGTDFQMSVWKEMMNIPYGKTLTYKQLAEKKNSKAVRAVGNACGKNPIPIIVPCHRVVGFNSIGGYSSGLNIKKELINIEKIKY